MGTKRTRRPPHGVRASVILQSRTCTHPCCHRRNKCRGRSWPRETVVPMYQASRNISLSSYGPVQMRTNSAKSLGSKRPHPLGGPLMEPRKDCRSQTPKPLAMNHSRSGILDYRKTSQRHEEITTMFLLCASSTAMLSAALRICCLAFIFNCATEHHSANNKGLIQTNASIGKPLTLSPTRGHHSSSSTENGCWLERKRFVLVGRRLSIFFPWDLARRQPVMSRPHSGTCFSALGRPPGSCECRNECGECASGGRSGTPTGLMS